MKQYLNDPRLHFKMYKSGKQWMIAGMLGLSLAGVFGIETTAHADTTTTTQATSVTATSPNANVTGQNTATSMGESASSTTGSNVTSNNGGQSQTVPVNVDHSELDKAVQSAKNNGLQVTQNPTNIQTVNQDQVNQAKQNDSADYSHQVTVINNQIQKKQQADANYHDNNGSTEDHSELDNVVKEAQSVAGLTVIKDADHNTTFKASDLNGTKKWYTDTKKDYANQIQNIQNAITTQKQKYQEWKANYDKQIAGIDPSHAVKTDQIYVPSQLDFANSDVDVSISQPYSTDTLWHGSLWDNSYNSKHQYLIKNPQNGLTITWHNAAIEKSTGRKLNITWTITDIVNVPKGDPSNWTSDLIKRQAEHGWAAPTQESQDADALNTITVYSNPIDVIGWANIAGFKVKETLSYSDDGSDYQGIYYHSAGSLNAQNTGDRWEFAAPISGVLGSFISPDSLIFPEEQSVSGKATSVTDKAFMIGPNKEYGSGMGGSYGDKTAQALTKEGVTFLVKNNSVIAYGVSGKSGTSQDAKAAISDSYLIPAYNEHLMGSTQIVAASVPMPTSSVHYHYDKVTVTPPQPTDFPVSYQLHNLDVTVNPSKHWEEDGKETDGKVYIDGDTAHVKISTTLNSLQDYDDGNLKSFGLEDDYSNFAKDVTVSGAKILEGDKDASDQYDVKVANGIVTATRRDPKGAPDGKYTMLLTFNINKGVKNIDLVNKGYVNINDHHIPTNTPTSHTEEPSPEKHFVEGQQVVDDKTYINNDEITGQVQMKMPDPSTLAKPLSNVQIADIYSQYANNVTIDSEKPYEVDENGTDVTNEYSFTNSNGVVTATRKDPSKAPGGTLTLKVHFKINHGVKSGTQFVNSGSGTLNTDTVPTNSPKIINYTPDTSKHFVEGSQNVDDKTYIAGDEVHGQVQMSLPDPSTLAKPLNNVQVADNYSRFANMVDYLSSQVLENGKDVTSEYTITNDRGVVTATRKNPGSTPAGNVRLIANFKLHKDIKDGTPLVNSGSGTLNADTVPTNIPKVIVFTPSAAKHWTEGKTIVDNHTYVNGDVVNTDVTMQVPSPSQLAKPLTDLQIADIYSKFTDKADLQGAKVYEAGQDATDQYDIKVSNGQVVATRRDASKAPGGLLDLHLTFKIKQGVPSGSELPNSGYGVINSYKAPAPDVIIKTYKTDAQKHWSLDNKITDNELYMNGTQAAADVTVNLPSNLGRKLAHFSMTDDYSNYASHVKVASTTVSENGKDVTDQYEIKVVDGKIVATRKDAGSTPEGKAVLHTVFDINADTPEGTVFINKGSAQVNDDYEEVPPTKIVTWTPKPNKDVGVNEQNGKIAQSVNGKLLADGTTVTYGLSNEDVPANRAQKITSQSIVDTLDSHAQYLGFKAFVKGANGQLEDVTSHIKLTQEGQKLTFTEDDYLLNRYNENMDKAVDVPLIDLYVKINGANVDVKNQYDLYTNGVKTTSNTVENKTPENPKPVKKDLNTKGVNIDGKDMLPGDTDVFEVDADYDQYQGIQADDDSIKGGFYIFDDYPEEALTPGNMSSFTAKDSQGKPVQLEYHEYKSLSEAPAAVQAAAKNSNIQLKGAFIVASPADPVAYFKKYVQTGNSVKVSMPMTVNDGFSGKYENHAYEVDFGHGYATNVTHNVVPKIDPKKDVILAIDHQQSLDGKTIKVGQVFDYSLHGVAVKNLGNSLTEYGWHDDYDQTHDESTGQVLILLDQDIKLTDGTKLQKGTDITKYATVTFDTVNGKVDIEMDKDFLAKVDPTVGFNATAYLQMKRIKAGTVKNTFDLTINGKKYKSNTVTTDTPEPPASKKTPVPTPQTPVAQPAPTPQPVPLSSPAPVTPAPEPEQQALPQTGNSNDQEALMAALGLGLVGMSMSLVGRKKRYE